MKKTFYLLLMLLLSIISAQAQFIEVVADVNANRLTLLGNNLFYSSNIGVYKIDLTQNPVVPVQVANRDATGLAVSGDILYFSEFNAGKISKIDLSNPSGPIETVIEGLDTPNGLLLDGNMMYFSDNNSNIVARFDVTATNPEYEIVAQSDLNFTPVGLAKKGNILYMSQALSNRVSSVDVTSGNIVPINVVTNLGRPLGIKLDDNNLIISEYESNKISIKDLADPSPLATDLVLDVNVPRDIEIYGSTLFIIESGNNRIIKVENLLGQDEYFSQEKLALYPNPTSDYVFLLNLKAPLPYSIFNILGEKVIQGTIEANEFIDVRNLKTGSYFLQLLNEEPMRFLKK